MEETADHLLVFVVYENTSPDGEDRDEWHHRRDLQKLTDEEWDARRPTDVNQLNLLP
jgi:hypothetical protein